jgi:hypothetical protein
MRIADNFISLGTKLKTEAIKRVDARRAAEAAAKLGIAIAPEEGRKPLQVTAVVQQYENDGYPDKRGNARPESPHRRSLKDACVLLSKFFKGATVTEPVARMCAL